MNLNAATTSPKAGDFTTPEATQASALAAIAAATSSFRFQNRVVRVIQEDGVEYFVALDLTPILGFKNARQAVRNHVAKADRHAVPIRDAIGRAQRVLAVNESGVYALVFGSAKPEAKVFKHFVTSEILPTLRKTGRFEIGQNVPALLESVTTMLRGRGRAKARQLNRIVAHRDGTFSFRVGRKWTHRVPPLSACALAPSHGLREGLAISALHLVRKTQEQARLVH
jgi:prophage antirepressor-like protein